MASQTKRETRAKSEMWVASLALHLHGYREFIVSRHRSLSAAPGQIKESPVLSLRRQTRHTYIFFPSLSLPHCVCLLSNQSLDSFQARRWTFQTLHISSASWHPRRPHAPAAISIPTSAKRPVYKHAISQSQVLHYFRPRNGQVGGNHRRTQPERFHH